MKTFDRNISRIIRQDNPECQADPAVEERLMYAYRLKRPAGRVHRNSFIPGPSVLFSGKNLVFKLTAVTLFFILTFHFQPWSTGNLKNAFLCDSANVQQQETRVQDSLILPSPSFSDSMKLK